MGSAMMNVSTTPSAEQLRELPTAKLGLIVLTNLGSQITVHSVLNHHKTVHGQNQEPDVDHLLGRLSDTWAWLVPEGCVGPHTCQPSTHYRVTERGRRLSEQDTL